MKKTYQAPKAEYVSFATVEEIANTPGMEGGSAENSYFNLLAEE